MVASLPLVLYAFGQKAYNYIFETQYRVGLFYRKWFIYGYFGVALIFGVVRNLY